MKNHTAYAHARFNRRQLLRFIFRGGLQVELEVNYKNQTLNWKWINPKKSKLVGVSK